MKIKSSLLISKIGLLLMMGASVVADAALFDLGEKAWKEEVLLHDGSKILVERAVELGGRHELGQKPPIKEQRLTFILPGTSKRVTWQDHYSEDVGSSNFNPMLLEIINGSPYVLASPAGCLPYNKWGRPNPPYVVFKYDGKEWKRISMEELPAEIKLPNLVIPSPDEVAKTAKNGVLSVKMIKEANEGFGRPQYKTILRNAYPEAADGCPEMIRTKEGWEGLGFMKRQSSYDACLKYCERRGISPKDCRCESLFKGAK